MPEQFIYKGKPTAKLTLFDLWDQGFDDDDDALSESLGISLSTIKSYRVEWKKREGKGVKIVKQVLVVTEDDIPFRTAKGVVWRVPLPPEKKLKCERCECREECQWWMRRGGYLGCEEVYEDELIGGER